VSRIPYTPAPRPHGMDFTVFAWRRRAFRGARRRL